MKRAIFLTIAVFLSAAFFYSDSYGKSERNRKIIKTIINKNPHSASSVDRSLFSDVKAYLCNETRTIELEFCEVRQGEIYVTDTGGQIIIYDSITSSEQILDAPSAKGTYYLIIDSPELYAEGLFTVE